jgi:hypothetical protein
MGNEHVDKLVDCAVRGAAMGGGFESIRSGKSGIVDGVVSGAVLGLVWRGAVVLADKTGLKEQVEKARDKLRK